MGVFQRNLPVSLRQGLLLDSALMVLMVLTVHLMIALTVNLALILMIVDLVYRGV